MHEALLGDRYLLCSDGLTDVVSDEAVHGVLSTVEEPEQAVGQLIALAIRNGGPDNITCIVADAIDADGPVPPSRDTVMAGAAAHGDANSLLRAATGNAAAAAPAGAEPAQPPSASLNGHLAGAAIPGEDDSDLFEEPRRRWPVVTSILVVLVLVVVAGLYVGYRSIQGNYYVGADGRTVSIYRGISQKIAFLSLSSVYAKTSLTTTEVPGDLTLPTTPTTLAKARATVASIQRSVTCTNAVTAQQVWKAQQPKPSPTPKAAKNSKTKRKPVPAPSPTPAKPEPVVPTYCAAQEAG
jgi:hypothetical protein